MTEISKAEFARALGISKARVSQFIKMGMPVTAPGLIDEEAAKRWIAANIDPTRRVLSGRPLPGPSAQSGKAGRSKSRGKEPAFQAVWDGTEDPAERGALMMGLHLIYHAESTTAGAVIASGGSCAVAHAAGSLAACVMMEQLKQFARGLRFSMFAFNDQPSIYNLDSFVRPDWEALAKHAGEPVDLAAWKAHVAKIDGTATMGDVHAPA